MFFPFQFSEVSEASFQKSAVTGSCTGTANDPISTGKIKLLKESKQEWALWQIAGIWGN